MGVHVGLSRSLKILGTIAQVGNGGKNPEQLRISDCGLRIGIQAREDVLLTLELGISKDPFFFFNPKSEISNLQSF
jgi:hypothetical protein